MDKRYFELFDDMTILGRWLLGPVLDAQGKELSTSSLFTQGERVEADEQFRISIDARGRPLDFSLAALGTPIVHARIASIIAELASGDVQLFPVRVESQPEQYLILNAVQTIRCIDDARCEEVAYWTEEDGVPWKVGQYEHVYGMRVDPSRIGDARVFRPWGWKVLVVSEDVKEALERAGATGVKFKEA